MDNQPPQDPEVPISLFVKCKLVIFLILTLSIVAYIGLCARIFFTAQYNYPSESPCEK